VVSATDFEIKPFKNKGVATLVTGIGIINSLFSVQEYLKSHNNIKKILVTGIGGGFKGKVEIGEICIAKKEILGDFGVCFSNRIEYIAENVLNINLELDKLPYKRGNFITVNCVTTKKEIIKFYEEKFSPICENMEGYAIAYLCRKLGIDFFEIRAISNFVGERNKWNTELAIEKLKNESEKIISEILQN